MKPTMEPKKKQPLQKFSSGSIKLTIWDKEIPITEGSSKTYTAYNFSVVKTYSKFDENTNQNVWEETTNFNKSDIANIKVVVDNAFNFLLSNDERDKKKKVDPLIAEKIAKEAQEEEDR